jgi:tetratricopeptide (TPR) repeat protein
LTAHDRQQLDVAAPGSGRAYELYLRANQVSRDLSKLIPAKDLYRAALEEDGGYAPAWARYARVCRVLAKYGHGHEAALNLKEAERAFARAFELNPDLPLAHSLYTHFELENGAARQALARLLVQARVRPSDPDLFTGLCAACRYGGLLDASIAAHRHARRLDPEVQTSVMYTYLMRGDYEEAIDADTEAIYVTPYALPLIGRADEARSYYRRYRESAPNSVSRMLAGFMLGALDHDVSGIREGAAQFRASAFADPEGYYFLARALAYVNDSDQALEIIEQCVEGGWTCPTPLLRDPWLDPIRGDPRLAKAIERAEEGKRAAQAVFTEHGGEKLLGME